MERKHGIWLVVLLILLVSTLVAVVLVKLQWDESEAALARANASLLQEEETARQLVERLKAAEDELDELKKATPTPTITPTPTPTPVVTPTPVITPTPVATPTPTATPAPTATPVVTPTPVPTPTATPMRTSTAKSTLRPMPTLSVSGDGAELDTIMAEVGRIAADADMDAREKIDALSDLGAQLGDHAGQLRLALMEADAEKAALEGELEAANAEVSALNEQIAKNAENTAALEADIAAANEKNASGEADRAALQSEIESLNESLTAERAAADELAAQLEDALSDYAELLAEIECYKVIRVPGEGEHYADNALGEVLNIAADGVTGVIELTNSSLSANWLALELLVGEESVYCSEALAPGESLDALVLSVPLALGEHEATAVLKTCSATGEVLSSQRMPVKIVVSGRK